MSLLFFDEEEMIKSIVKDMLFLQQKAQPASKEDVGIGQDLFDTLKANQDKCVGMAANMIGVQKQVIIFMYGMVPVIMFNPILKKSYLLTERKNPVCHLWGVA